MKALLKTGGLALVLWLASFAAWAYCDTAGTTFTISPGTVTVQRDVAVGQPLSDWIYSNEGTAYNNCNYDSLAQYAIESGIKSYNGRPSGMLYNNETVFNTNLSGVGFVLEGNSMIGGSSWAGWQGIQGNKTERALFSVSYNAGSRPSFSDQARIKLIKTGNIQGGSLSGSVGYFYVGVRETAAWSTEVAINFSGGTVTSVACSVTSSNVDVPLDDHNKSEFTGPGATTAWHPFNIDLECDQSASINVRIDAPQDPSNIAGVMKLDNAGSSDTASGVGIQLWYAPDGGTAVQFGQQNHYYTSPYGGHETVQLQARYYQTAKTVTPGQANGTATFTLTYK